MLFLIWGDVMQNQGLSQESPVVQSSSLHDEGEETFDIGSGSERLDALEQARGAPFFLI